MCQKERKRKHKIQEECKRERGQEAESVQEVSDAAPEVHPCCRPRDRLNVRADAFTCIVFVQLSYQQDETLKAHGANTHSNPLRGRTLVAHAEMYRNQVKGSTWDAYIGTNTKPIRREICLDEQAVHTKTKNRSWKTCLARANHGNAVHFVVCY